MYSPESIKLTRIKLDLNVQKVTPPETGTGGETEVPETGTGEGTEVPETGTGGETEVPETGTGEPEVPWISPSGEETRNRFDDVIRQRGGRGDDSSVPWWPWR